MAPKPAVINAGDLIDNFNFALVGAGSKFPFRSYVTSIDPTNAEPGVFIMGSQNVYKTLKETVAVRPGLKRRGVANATLAGTKSSYEWNTSLGFTRVLRVENGKLEVEFDTGDGTGLNWYSLLTGLTLSRFVFDPWWDDSLKKDALIMVKGDTVLHRWSGGIGVVAAVSNGAGFIATINQPYAGTSNTDSGGAGYAVGDLLTVTGGTAVIYVDAVAPGGVKTHQMAAAGAGYSVNDLLVVATENGGFPALVKVASVNGSGNVVTYTLISSGSGYVGNAAAALATTYGGAGTGFTLNVLTVGDAISAWHVQTNGSGYSPATQVALTGGSGTGAAVDITAVATGSITLTGNQNIAQLGFEGTLQLLINGTTWSYTASNGAGGQSFTGVSGDPSAIPIGSVVLQVVVTENSTPANAPTTFTNDFIKVINNQLHVGSYNSRFVYVSANDAYTDFSVPGTRAQGDPDLLTLDSQARGITVQKGSSGQAGNAVISGGLGDWYTIIRSQITVGTTLEEQVTVTKSESADLATALAHEFITIVGDNILFLDQNNQLREFGTVRNISNPVFPLLSLDIFTELKSLDFTGGHLRAVADEGGETIYLTCPLSGIDYFYQIRQRLTLNGDLSSERIWHPPQVRGLSRIAVIDGVTYGHSTSNPQLYQLWDTGQWHDDSPSNEELPYEAHLFLAYLNGGRTQEVIFSRLFAEGYMTMGTPLYVNVYEEYQGAKNIARVILNNPGKGSKHAKFYTGVTSDSLGDAPLGDNPLGDGIALTGGDDATVPKFRCIRGVTATDLFEYALDVYSNTPDSRWELLTIGVNQVMSTRRPVGITS